MRNIFAEVVFSKVDTDNNFCRNPFKSYPQIFQTASGKSLAALSWSHYAALLQVNDPVARAWYEQEAAQQTWSVRTLQRYISATLRRIAAPCLTKFSKNYLSCST